MTDPIADMLTRIRNAVSAKHTRVDMPASRIKADIARILQDEGYIQGFKVLDAPPGQTTAVSKVLRVFLKYGPHGERLITGVQRISRQTSSTNCFWLTLVSAANGWGIPTKRARFLHARCRRSSPLQKQWSARTRTAHR
jgi:ribosomal protein S8